MNRPENSYVVVGCRSWNREVFDSTISRFDGRWSFFGSRAELTADRLEELRPRFVFFLHWSWIVPSTIVDRFECICFHMTDLPFGRGGSPLQNLIARGHRKTVMTAFKMTDELDAGPIYLKRPFSLDGSAREIFLRATEVSATMIEKIITDEPEPRPQTGEGTTFTRRKPDQSEITLEFDDSRRLYDHIRMLDAEGYPAAYLRFGNFVFSFSNATLESDRISAVVEIEHIPTEE